jgi:hypothetical protein
MRRIIYAVIIFSLIHLPGIQLVTLMLLNLAMLVYVGKYSPLEGRSSNMLEKSNELCVSFITFCMAFFTPWVLGYDIELLPDKMLSPVKSL